MDKQDVAAIILAAGVGKRMQGWELPKSLLSFSGESLLERHVQALRGLGINDIHIVGGYRIDAIAGELTRLGDSAHLLLNTDHRRGSMLSLRAAAEILRSGKHVVLMDADVLFAPEMLAALVASEHPNSLLVDMHPVDDEAVKLCFAGDVIVDFHKRPQRPYDRCGESVGFFRLAPAMAAALADRCDDYVAQGQFELEYEAPLRDLMLARPELFGAEDISGHPWIELDFDTDVQRATHDILPALEARIA